MSTIPESERWREGFYEPFSIGSIAAAEQNGRRYFDVRVSFPPSSDWWPRTTETGTVKEARDWIREQHSDYLAHCPKQATPT